MPEIRTILSWKAFSDPSLDPTDLKVLLFLSFSQAKADCAVLHNADIAAACDLRPQNSSRSTRKLAEAGHISIAKVPNSRAKRYEVPSVTTRNKENYWAKQRRQAELQDVRDRERKIAAHNRSKLTVIHPTK